MVMTRTRRGGQGMKKARAFLEYLVLEAGRQGDNAGLFTVFLQKGKAFGVGGSHQGRETGQQERRQEHYKRQATSWCSLHGT